MRSFKYWIYPKASKYISRTILAEGLLRESGQPFRCLFADNSLFTEYLMHRMYAEPPRIIRERKIWIPALKRLVASSSEDFDLCVAVLPERYEEMFRGLYAFRGREYVRQIIDTSGTWEEIRDRFHKKKRQFANTMAAKHGFSYRISKDMKDFDFFYRRMHLPHIKKQFGEGSDIDSYAYMKHFFRSGFLLLVMKDGMAVTGALSLAENGVLTFRRTGVLDGDEVHVRSGAQMALYYFQILIARERRLDKLDTMCCRPFLDDRVYRTKREWGAAVYPDGESELWTYFFIPRYSGGVVSFFQDNPAIVLAENGLMGVVGTSETREFSAEGRKDLVKRFSAPGLEGLFLLAADAEKPSRLLFEAVSP